MSLAETANLVADLQLKDHLSATAKTAAGNVKGLDSAVSGTTQRMGVMASVSQRVSGSMGHFTNRLSGLAKGIGILGVGGAAVATTKFLKDSFDAAMSFGDAVDRVSTLTGMGAQQTSKFVDALGYYGIEAAKAQSITGMYLKNVDALTETKKKAVDFEKQYGFALTDSNGKVKDAQDIITSFTDYFNNKSIPASQRAAAGAKLFGRSWQELLPIFQSGGKEWRKQLDAGLELTKEDIRQMKEARRAQRDWTDAIGDFQTIVGIKLLPTFTELAKAASEWLNDKGNQKTLLGFLDQGIKLGKDLAGFLSNRVVPAVRDLASGAKAFWDSLPGPLQDLLVTGVVADRTIKYLFGFSVTGVATDVLGGVIKEGIGGIASKLGFTRGSSPMNPLYVTGTGFGGGGGGMGPGGAAGGGMKGQAGMLLRGLGGAIGFAAGDMLADAGSNSAAKGTTEGGMMRVAGSLAKVESALLVGGPIAGAVMLGVETFNTGLETLRITTEAQAELTRKAEAARQQDSVTALSNLDKTVKGLRDVQGIDRIIGDTVAGKQQMDALVSLTDSIVNNGPLSAKQITGAIDLMKQAQVEAIARGNNKVADHIGENIKRLQSVTAKGDDKTAGRIDQLKGAVRSGDQKQSGLLSTIASQPTKVNVTIPVTTSVSVRDLDTTTRTTSRYGFQAI
jgi:polyhydroxyalkanoate synthesis regulator phasin